MTRFIHILFVVLFLPSIAYSQERGAVRLLCGPQPESILLRWAPSDRQTWQSGNRHGYVVERYTMLRDGQPVVPPFKEILTSDPLKPEPLEVWERHVDEDKYVGISAECIFGKDSMSTGGNPHLVARRYREEQNRFAFALYAADQSPLTARLSGLYMADRTALKNEKYLYRVYIPVPDVESAADTAFAFTGISEYQPLPPPLDLKAKWGDGKVELSWDILYHSHVYTSYVVEKSEDGEQFTPLSDNAIVQLSDIGVTPHFATKTDTLAHNKTDYYYRVRGMSAFGEKGPPCEAISGRGRKPLTQAPTITGSETIDNKKIALAWSYPEEMNEYITGFAVYRSSDPQKPKEKLHECRIPSLRTYVDERPDVTNYYAISVFDDEKELFSSNVTYSELVDSIPPSAPAGFAGTIDGTGKVRLHWNRSPDTDTEGYRIYRANRADFEFLLITPRPVSDTVFVDSINIKTLTRDVHYRVRAIDARQNHSSFSDVLTLARPDVIPPVTPVIETIEERNGTLAVTWINSTSSDVARHHVWRKEKNDTAYVVATVIDKTSDTQSTYVDQSVKPGGIYAYYVTAEDLSGLSSEASRPVQLKVPSGIAENIRLTGETYTDKVVLRWDIDSEKTVGRVLIYRAEKDAPIRLHGNTSETSFTDKRPAPEKSFTYRVKAVYEDESTSSLSNAITVNN